MGADASLGRLLKSGGKDSAAFGAQMGHVADRTEGVHEVSLKKEEMRRGARHGFPLDDDLQLLKLILDEQPRLKERVTRYIEAKLRKSKGETKPKATGQR